MLQLNSQEGACRVHNTCFCLLRQRETDVWGWPKKDAHLFCWDSCVDVGTLVGNSCCSGVLLGIELHSRHLTKYGSSFGATCLSPIRYPRHSRTFARLELVEWHHIYRPCWELPVDQTRWSCSACPVRFLRTKRSRTFYSFMRKQTSHDGVLLMSCTKIQRYNKSG